MKNDHQPQPIVLMDGEGRVVEVVGAAEFKKQRPSRGFKPPKVCRMTPEERIERAQKASAARWRKKEAAGE